MSFILGIVSLVTMIIAISEAYKLYKYSYMVEESDYNKTLWYALISMITLGIGHPLFASGMVITFSMFAVAVVGVVFYVKIRNSNKE